MGWVTSWAGYSLAIPSVCFKFVPALLAAEQILGGKVFGFLGVLKTSLLFCLTARCHLFIVHNSVLSISAKITSLAAFVPSHSYSQAHSTGAPTLTPLPPSMCWFHFIFLALWPSLVSHPSLKLPFFFLNYCPIQFSPFHLPLLSLSYPVLSEIQPCSFVPCLVYCL